MLGRDQLKFAESVRRHFAFLRQRGFKEVSAEDTLVRFSNGALNIDVFHGRTSFEIGLEVESADERFSLEEIARLSNASAADECRRSSARTQGAVDSGVADVAKTFESHGARALHDFTALLPELQAQREAWLQQFEQEVLARQLRPKAEQAFRERRYPEAAALYQRFSSQLTPAERKKLEVARRRTTAS